MLKLLKENGKEVKWISGKNNGNVVKGTWTHTPFSCSLKP